MHTEPDKQTFRESLIPHLQATLAMDWQHPPAHIAALLDQLVIKTPWMRISPEMAEQIPQRCGHDAFDLVIKLAEQQKSILFETMQQVQKLILGIEDVSFRKHSAYTSVRPERYAYFSGIEEMFRKKIKQDDEEDVHPLLKAVRLYLDIIFFHPFDDGNARASMLWLTFGCVRANYTVPDLRKVIMFPFEPGSKENYWQFASLVLSAIRK